MIISNLNSRIGSKLIVVFSLILSACQLDAKNEGAKIVEESTTTATEIKTNEDQMKKTKDEQSIIGDTSKIKISLPSPKEELPTVSYDKKKLSKIGELDKMLTDAEVVKIASKQFEDMFMEMKNATETNALNGNGSTEDQVRAINNVAGSFKKFELTGKIFGEKIIALVQKNYKNDSEFTSRYRTLYYEAEDQVREIIQEIDLRRKVLSEMSTVYKYGSEVDSYFIESKLKEASELKSSVIGSLLSTASTNLMLADYKKGRELTDLLSSTLTILNATGELSPAESEAVNIEEMKGMVAEVKKKRTDEIAKSRESYRFPVSYKGGNAPANAAELERKMKAFLEKFTYNGKDKYSVQKIAVAGPWIEVRSSLGVLLYYQIDFYVANKYRHNDPGVISVDLVTLRTNGPDTKAFGNYSIGLVGEMLEKNVQ